MGQSVDLKSHHGYNRSKMADHAVGDDMFVYTGGRAPQHVVNAIIDESVD
jgi:hypothetical protein